MVAAKYSPSVRDNAVTMIGAFTVHMRQRWTFIGSLSFVHILSAAAINWLYTRLPHMLSCKQRQRLTGQTGFLQLQVLEGAASSELGDWSVSDCLRLSYRGALEEAVCLHPSFYLHRLQPYIKLRALP